MQKVQVIGNLTKDVELRKVKANDKEFSVATLSVAVNGINEEDTLFIDFDIWSKQAENAGKFLQKGSKVFIEGTMQNNVYEKDGIKHYGFRFRADSVEYLSTKKIEETKTVAKETKTKKK